MAHGGAGWRVRVSRHQLGSRPVLLSFSFPAGGLELLYCFVGEKGKCREVHELRDNGGEA